MAREATLSVSLTKKLKKYVRDKVDNGTFESASEVIRQGLRTMQEQEERERLYWSGIRKLVKEGRDAIDARNVVDGPAFMKSKIAAMQEKTRSKPAVTKRHKRS